jgi:hypothetical protein
MSDTSHEALSEFCVYKLNESVIISLPSTKIIPSVLLSSCFVAIPTEVIFVKIDIGYLMKS